MQVQSLVVGNGSPLQYSCLENFTDRGTWQATVHGVTKSQTRLSTRACARTHTHTHTVLPGSSSHCLPSVYRNKHTHGQHAGIYTHGHVCMPVTTNCASVRVPALLLTPITSLGVLQEGVAGAGRGIT